MSMPRRAGLRLLLLLLPTALLGCGMGAPTPGGGTPAAPTPGGATPGAPTPGGGSPGGPTTLGPGDAGKPITLRPGQGLVVALPSNPSTGFTWQVAALDGAVLRQEGEPAYVPTTTTPLPGSGGTQTFRFQAVAPGQATLTLTYLRPFEKGVPPGQTFTVPVTVS